MKPSDAGSPAERIASALARLRGTRPGPFGRPGADSHGGARFGPPWEKGHGRGHGPWGGPDGPPWRRGEHGPLARFAARFRALEALHTASSPLSVSELAKRIGVDQPRASRLVQALVEEGHVRREVDPDDARRANIVLTDAGRAAVVEARGARVSAVDRALADFTPAEQEQLATLLARLADAWSRG